MSPDEKQKIRFKMTSVLEAYDQFDKLETDSFTKDYIIPSQVFEVE